MLVLDVVVHSIAMLEHCIWVTMCTNTCHPLESITKVITTVNTSVITLSNVYICTTMNRKYFACVTTSIIITTI